MFLIFSKHGILSFTLATNPLVAFHLTNKHICISHDLEKI